MKKTIEEEFIETWTNYFRPYDRKRSKHELIELIKSAVKENRKNRFKNKNDVIGI